MFTPLALVRLVWFVVFFRMAKRAHVLGGKNALAALVAGFGAGTIILKAPEGLRPPGLQDWNALDVAIKEIVFEGMYLILFPVLFVLIRRLFKLRGFGRDFWLVVAMMAPLAWVMIWTVFLVYLSFHYGPM